MISRATILIAIVLCCGCTMDSFLFNPTPLTTYTLSNTIIPDTSRTEVLFTSGGETLAGYFVRQPDSLRVAPHPTVVYHHGNKDNLAYYWDRVELLYQAGFDVFIYDYRGYGKSTGTSSETGLRQDAMAAHEYIVSRKDVDTSMICQYGYSLGGYPAFFLAATTRTHALITECTFASGESLVQSGTLLNVPGSYFLEGTFGNTTLAQQRTCPLLILHGTNDTFISVDQGGQAIYNVAQAPKMFLRVQGAGHTNIPHVMGTNEYIRTITSFIRGN